VIQVSLLNHRIFDDQFSLLSLELSREKLETFNASSFFRLKFSFESDDDATDKWRRSRKEEYS